MSDEILKEPPKAWVEQNSATVMLRLGWHPREPMVCINCMNPEDANNAARYINTMCEAAAKIGARQGTHDSPFSQTMEFNGRSVRYAAPTAEGVRELMRLAMKKEMTMSDENKNERRWRLVAVREEIILSLFRDYDVFFFPRFTNVPDGFKVISVKHSFSHGAFMFCIEHPSFSPVEFGMEIPQLAAEMVTFNNPNKAPPQLSFATESMPGAPCTYANWQKPFDITTLGNTISEVYEATGIESAAAQATAIGPAPKPARKGKWEFLGAP